MASFPCRLALNYTNSPIFQNSIMLKVKKLKNKNWKWFSQHSCFCIAISRPTFKYPSWAKLCSPTLDCTAILQFYKSGRGVRSHDIFQNDEIWSNPMLATFCLESSESELFIQKDKKLKCQNSKSNSNLIF